MSRSLSQIWLVRMVLIPASECITAQETSAVTLLEQNASMQLALIILVFY